MRIATYLNTTQREVASKKHNIWIGISLGNKYFTPTNVRSYIEWALDNNKSQVLILIADAIQAINIEVLDGRSPAAALRKARKAGEQKRTEIHELMSRLPASRRSNIHLQMWDEVTANEAYTSRLKKVVDYYKREPEFRDYIINVILESRPDRRAKIQHLQREKIDRLAEYVLQELPIFVDGVQDNEGTVYTLIPYPGLSKLDELFVGLNNGTAFPDLADQLGIKNKIATLEMYAN